MKSPYLIEGPALISFSGGRSSAYMVCQIVRAHGGDLPRDIKVAFANTGKEMPQTLDFVRECSERLGVEVVWIEYRDAEETDRRWHIVDYETAARAGEPYDALIARKQYLPNPVTRFCTSELKIRPARDYAQSLGWEHWDVALGLRADEPRRVAKARVNREAWQNIVPLYDAGVTRAEVSAFWARQNWGLDLPSVSGVTPLGNCDLCFLKSAATIAGIMRDMPERADWWIKAEAEAKASKPGGARFRQDRPSYAEIFDAVQRQGDFFLEEEPLTDCFCHD